MELLKKQQDDGFITDIQVGISPRKAHLKKVFNLVNSYPRDKVRVLGRDESEPELQQFRKLFDGFAKDLIYNKQMGKFKEFAESETVRKVE